MTTRIAGHYNRKRKKKDIQTLITKASAQRLTWHRLSMQLTGGFAWDRVTEEEVREREWRSKGKRCVMRHHQPLRAPDTTTSFSRSRNFPAPSRFSLVPGTLFTWRKASSPQVHLSRSLQAQVPRPLFIPRPFSLVCAKCTSAGKEVYALVRYERHIHLAETRA